MNVRLHKAWQQYFAASINDTISLCFNMWTNLLNYLILYKNVANEYLLFGIHGNDLCSLY
ncbi:hypothetical protein D1872_213520 [compost metagenome]